MDTSSEITNDNNAKGDREKLNKYNLCDYAPGQAGHLGHLRTHMKTHLGEKSYKCNQCDYASVQSSHLRTHLKTHSGKKSYECNQCEYASVQAAI